MCKFGGANGHLDRPQRRNLHMGHVPAMHGPKEGTDGGKHSELGLGACKDRHVGHEVVAEHAMLRMLMMIAVTNGMTMMMTMMMTVTMTMFTSIIWFLAPAGFLAKLNKVAFGTHPNVKTKYIEPLLEPIPKKLKLCAYVFGSFPQYIYVLTAI